MWFHLTSIPPLESPQTWRTVILLLSMFVPIINLIFKDCHKKTTEWKRLTEWKSYNWTSVTSNEFLYLENRWGVWVTNAPSKWKLRRWLSSQWEWIPTIIPWPTMQSRKLEEWVLLHFPQRLTGKWRADSHNDGKPANKINYLFLLSCSLCSHCTQIHFGF